MPLVDSDYDKNFVKVNAQHTVAEGLTRLRAQAGGDDWHFFVLQSDNQIGVLKVANLKQLLDMKGAHLFAMTFAELQSEVKNARAIEKGQIGIGQAERWVRDEPGVLVILDQALVVGRMYGAAEMGSGHQPGRTMLQEFDERSSIPQNGGSNHHPDDIKPSSSLEVTRFSELQFLEQVVLDQHSTLVVTINRERKSEAAGQTELTLRQGQWPLKVAVSIARADGFLIEGPGRGIIEVPREANSKPLVFSLLPRTLGEKTIKVRFEQDNAFLGVAKLFTEVVEQVVAEPGQAKVDNPQAIRAVGLPPDWTIYIERVDEDDDRHFVVAIRTKNDDPEEPSRELDSIRFAVSPANYVQQLIRDLNTRTRGKDPNVFDSEVKKIGSTLYDKLFTKGQDEDGFKAYFWEHMYESYPSESRKSIQIVSDEPYIPWEILRPNRQLSNGRWRSDELFFCERFDLSRWLEDVGSVSMSLPFLKVVLVKSPSNLVHVEEEVRQIKLLPGLVVEAEIEDKEDLEAFLKEGQADVIHFACHGEFNLEQPDRSVVSLGQEEFRPFDLTAEYRNFGRFGPLVFMNACDTGKSGIGLTQLDGWAQEFLRSNVGFFVGAVWKVQDEKAKEFAIKFYKHLLAGRPVGQALRLAREAIKESGDSTYLSYSLYANPLVRAARAIQ